MCKYCEEVERTDESYVQYGIKGDHYIAYRKKAEQFALWSVDDNCTSVIQFCPWCGRELELPDDEAEFSADDEIKRLEGRINYTNKMVGHLVDDVGALLDLIPHSIISSADRQGLIAGLKSLRGKFPE